MWRFAWRRSTRLTTLTLGNRMATIRTARGIFGVVTSVTGSTTADLNADPQPGRAVQLVGKFFF